MATSDGDGELAKRFRAGDIRALARAISLVERRDRSVRALEEPPRGKTAVAPVVGLAGPSSAVPMGVVIAGCVLLSLVVWRRWEAGK